MLYIQTREILKHVFITISEAKYYSSDEGYFLTTVVISKMQSYRIDIVLTAEFFWISIHIKLSVLWLIFGKAGVYFIFIFYIHIYIYILFIKSLYRQYFIYRIVVSRLEKSFLKTSFVVPIFDGASAVSQIQWRRFLLWYHYNP